MASGNAILAMDNHHRLGRFSFLTLRDGTFARHVNGEVACDYATDTDKTIPIDQLNASNDE
jgi:hypothetical protein